MRLLENIDLADYTTFGIHARCRYFVEYESCDELARLCSDARFSGLKKMVLGGGSNSLFVGDYTGVIFHPVNDTVEVIDENEDFRFVRVGAGKRWTPFVQECVERGWSGVENLAYVPGSVGGAVVQNIGAYGLEIAERISEVECFNPQTGLTEILSNADCDYGYRTSVFKHKCAHLIVHSVTLALPKVFTPNVGYKAIAAFFENTPPSTPAEVAEIITQTRRRKLPEPGVIGSAGSFFKNPVVTRVKEEHLLEETPQLVSYRLAGGRSKLAAGWMIDAVGMKGMRVGDAGVYDKNALVLVNYGQATGEEILKLANTVADKVYHRFGVRLEPEPVIIQC